MTSRNEHAYQDHSHDTHDVPSIFHLIRSLEAIQLEHVARASARCGSWMMALAVLSVVRSRAPLEAIQSTWRERAREPD